MPQRDTAECRYCNCYHVDIWCDLGGIINEYGRKMSHGGETTAGAGGTALASQLASPPLQLGLAAGQGLRFAQEAT